MMLGTLRWGCTVQLFLALINNKACKRKHFWRISFFSSQQSSSSESSCVSSPEKLTGAGSIHQSPRRNVKCILEDSCSPGTSGQFGEEVALQHKSDDSYDHINRILREAHFNSLKTHGQPGATWSPLTDYAHVWHLMALHRESFTSMAQRGSHFTLAQLHWNPYLQHFFIVIVRFRFRSLLGCYNIKEISDSMLCDCYM